MSDKIYITKNSDSKGMTIHVTEDVHEVYDAEWEATQIVTSLYDNLPGVTLAWVRTMLDKKIGKIEAV